MSGESPAAFARELSPRKGLARSSRRHRQRAVGRREGQDPKVSLSNVLYIKTDRRRGGFVENVTVEKIDAATGRFKMGVFGIETATPFRIIGDAGKPVMQTVVRRGADAGPGAYLNNSFR